MHEHHQPVGIGKRLRFQQYRIDDRENRSVCTNAQRQGHNRCQREDLAFSEHPEGMLQILEKSFHVYPFVLKTQEKVG